jgi:hypothetical protein
MFRYVRKHHLFASFASYSLQISRTNSNTNIRFVAKQITISHTGEYLLRNNIRFEAKSRKTFNEFHIEANGRCKYSHTSEYLLANICIPNFRFVLLQVIKESILQS